MRAALEVRRRRSAFEVDLSRGHGGEAVLGRDGLVLDGEVRAPELASDVVDDLEADVDGVADGPLSLRQKRERDRALAITDGYRRRVVHLLEGAGQLAFGSRGCGSCGGRQAEQSPDHEPEGCNTARHTASRSGPAITRPQPGPGRDRGRVAGQSCAAGLPTWQPRRSRRCCPARSSPSGPCPGTGRCR